MSWIEEEEEELREQAGEGGEGGEGLPDTEDGFKCVQEELESNSV